jgi:hypothetical protein
MDGRVLVTTPNAEFAFTKHPSYGSAEQQVIDSNEDASADGDDHRFLFSRSELISVIRAAGFRVEDSGLFVPFWLSGHLKTRHLYRLIGGKNAVRLAIPDLIGVRQIHRRLCSSQFLLAKRG